MKTLFCIALLLVTAVPTQFQAAETDQAETSKDVVPVTIFKNLQAGKKQTAVVYGTSLTAGGAWAGALKEYFDKHFPGQVTFVNSGGPGQNSNWGVANLKQKVLAHGADLVLIEFSYNDAHAKFKLPVEKAAGNLDAMVQALREQNPRMDIVLQTMNVPWDPPVENKPLANRPKLEDYNDTYRQYAGEHGLPLVDHYPNWLKLQEENPQKYQKWLPDGSHPTREASLAITWPAIEALLEKGRQAAAD